MGELVTLAQAQEAMPAKKNMITQEALDIINSSTSDPEFQGESLLKTASIYESVIKGSRASIPEYLNAIRFCAYMVSNGSNYTEAYKKVFADREFVKQRAFLNTEDPKYKELCSAASRYRRTKLVTDILTVSQVPLDLIFTGERYKALGVLAQIMENGRYDRDKINAAKELLAATKGPENIKMELDVGITESSAVEKLNDELAIMAARQKAMLESGASNLQEFGSMKVVEGTTIEGEYEEHG